MKKYLAMFQSWINLWKTIIFQERVKLESERIRHKTTNSPAMILPQKRENRGTSSLRVEHLNWQKNHLGIIICQQLVKSLKSKNWNHITTRRPSSLLSSHFQYMLPLVDMKVKKLLILDSRSCKQVKVNQIIWTKAIFCNQ